MTRATGKGTPSHHGLRNGGIIRSADRSRRFDITQGLKRLSGRDDRFPDAVQPDAEPDPGPDPVQHVATDTPVLAHRYAGLVISQENRLVCRAVNQNVDLDWNGTAQCRRGGSWGTSLKAAAAAMGVTSRSIQQMIQQVVYVPTPSPTTYTAPVTMTSSVYGSPMVWDETIEMVVETHKSPDVNCTCGFYAVPLGQSIPSEYARMPAELIVELSGQLVEQENPNGFGVIYRAERQRILEVRLRPCVCGRTATALYVTACADGRKAVTPNGYTTTCGDHVVHGLMELTIPQLRSMCPVPVVAEIATK